MTDALDRQIVDVLCRNGRADATAIAEELDVVATTVQKRLAALEERGAIRGYTVRLDYDRLGYTTVVLHVDTRLETAAVVTTRLRETAGIRTVYEVTGEYNVVAIGRVTDEAAIGTMLQRLHADSAVRDVEVHTVTSVVYESC